MEPIEKKSINFLTELTRIINNMKMYNEKHPTVKQGTEKVKKMLDEILMAMPSLTFGTSAGALLIQNKQITERNAIADAFVKILADRNCGGVIMRKGTPISEIEAFIKLMSTKADEVVMDGAIKEELLMPFKKMSINEIKFIKLDDGEDLEDLTEARKFFNEIFADEFKDLKGKDALAKIGGIIKKILPKLAEQGFEKGESDIELKEFFEKSVETFGGAGAGGGVAQTRQSLISSIQKMDPKTQKMMFGEVIKTRQQLEKVLKNFSPERRANILANETENAGQMTKALDGLLKTKGEVVEIAEAISKKFAGADEEKLGQIFSMLQQMDSGGKDVAIKRGKAILADAEEEFCEELNKMLTKMGFEVEVILNGRDVLKKIMKSKPMPDLLVMDIKLPDLSGIEILSQLDMGKMRVPVVLITEMVSVKNSFEVQMYPKLSFVKKPCELGEVMAGIDKLVPPPPMPEPPPKKVEAKPTPGKTAAPAPAPHHQMSEAMEHELKKAREIQRNLLPKNTPNMPGFEVFSFYKACDMVGGDYYDIIEIGEDHVGFLVADVAGHGITGAMVMVMVRSAIRTWAHTTVSPKELLAKANPMVARDILPGFFCSVYYAILNIPEKKLLCSCAGHNPSVIWRQKTKKSEFTKMGGMPLGIVGGAAFEKTLQEEEIQLERGDRVVLYTDGVVETMSPDEEEYGEDRFCDVINKVAGGRSDVCVKQLIKGVLVHQSTAPQHDDLTLLTVRAI